jgi:hypothetical protein
MGHAAFWGMTLIANNGVIFVLALFSQICNFLIKLDGLRPRLSVVEESERTAAGAVF